MYSNKTFLAIIPARGGSKRLPRKNILEIAGKPLIAWSIEAALKSKYLDSVVVTSEDPEIIEISQKYGVNIVIRPHELALDTASTFAAVLHAIENNPRYDYIVLLQPTSPLRNSSHINEAIEVLLRKDADAIVSVCEMDHSPLWSNTLPEDESMNDFIRNEIKNVRSQELPIHYRLNGAIYICSTDKLLKEKTFLLQSGVYAYKMNRQDSVDIDEKIDFLMATMLLENSCAKEK